MTSERKEGVESETMFCDLPMEVVTHILSFLTFEELSFARAVSKNFDALARSLLNASFFRLGEQLELAMGNVKKMLPKRESQRRNHSLSRVNEVYSALETRYALLGMTFRKHIDDDSCCFIAGKVLDEAFALLRTLNSCVKRNEQPRETQELLKDIRDYSRLLKFALKPSFTSESFRMAMEYFDEQIAPTLRTKDPLSLLYRSHGRCPSFSITLPRSAPASINASLRSLCNSPCASTSSLCGGGSSVLGEMSKLFEWRKDVEEKLKKQERAIREQGAAINNIIECMHQISAKISLNCTKGLKTLGESSCSHFGETDASVRSNSLLTVPSSETRGRKRKADSCVGLTHKISTRVLSDT
ncbi:unnamed protein product [Toxocara canis]|uniref:F-box domain-containing protein n=1 Tax=Toxocara canis TaxID=6265 RepID=A0A183UH40_TOXCA|nr:unnamed protein product [Toxocara canis]